MSESGVQDLGMILPQWWEDAVVLTRSQTLGQVNRHDTALLSRLVAAMVLEASSGRDGGQQMALGARRKRPEVMM